MGSYSIGNFSRREILKMSAVLTGARDAVCAAGAPTEAAGLPRTPGQILRGPFYPLKELPQTAQSDESVRS